MVPAIIALIIGVLAVVAAIVGVLRFSKVNIKAKETALSEKLSKSDFELTQKAHNAASLLPDTLLAEAQKLIKDAGEALDKERNQLKTIEGKLDIAQKNVEEKEVSYQEKRSAKEDEEKRIVDLKAVYDVESEALITLEKKLSESMKNLDKLLSELTLTPAQQTAMQELSQTLQTAAGRLRELSMEYKAVADRIERLGQQHKDLEEEYTRLVEKQLGT